MQLISQSLIPLAFVIGLGWFAGWRNIIDARLRLRKRTMRVLCRLAEAPRNRPLVQQFG
jgi:hypothetical protein